MSDAGDAKEGPAPTFDAEGRRTDGAWLSYGDYVNVEALRRAQRVPRELPKGRAPAEWPAWPTLASPPEGGPPRTWRPGDAWPREWPHDEHLFLVTHQAFELWFKQMLLDVDDVLSSAREVGERHGATLPRDGPARAGDHRTLTTAMLRLFPALARAAEGLDADERRWLLEMPVPGFARSPSRTWSLAWIEPAMLARWTARLSRCAKTLVHATGAYDILATMPPEAFLEFRGRLVPASGFGSVQFRELEIALGLAHARRGMTAPPRGERVTGLSEAVTAPSPATPREAADLALARHLGPDELVRLDRRLREPSLRDLLRALLDAPELCGADDRAFHPRVDEVATANVTALHLDYRRESMHPQGDLGARMATRWQEIGRLLAPPENVALSWLYRNPHAHLGLVAFLDAAFELDQALTRWRTLHVSFVERMIGARPGTGGGGLEYLRRTLELPHAFPWLWDFRTILMTPVA